MAVLGGMAVAVACGGGDHGGAGVATVTERPGVVSLVIGDRIAATARVDPRARSCLNAWHIKLPGYEFGADPATVPVDWDAGDPSRSGTLVITDGSSASWFGATFSTWDADVRFVGNADGLISFAANCVLRPVVPLSGGTTV